MRIIAAAIRWRGATFTAPPPARHHDIFHQIRAAFRVFDYSGKFVSGEEQGFLTSEGTFVGRVAALAIAQAAGQLKPDRVNLPDLYSEDLW